MSDNKLSSHPLYNFLSAAKNQHKYSLRDIGILWKKYDTDGNKRLDREEFARFYKDLADSLQAIGDKFLKQTKEEVDTVFAIMDSNGNGTISLNEFVSFFEDLFGEGYEEDID
eukprot:TRINITY_DN6892_c0_g1_i1.p1 TRINITY_DN6892_c0_g1~~TRINITY_DN6892_c0_g1_i1.p1  ORF type:complete len:113 (+),score=23.68 TRINITY_DN6892_c0_g1_i1:51-389(+)